MREPLFLILLFIFTLSIGVKAQENKPNKISGVIVSQDSVSIAYANITTNRDRSIGTFSDSGGKFELKFSSEPGFDTLLVTCLGYEDAKFVLPTANTQLRIVLKPKSYILPEAVVTSDTALLIVKKAVERLKFNLADKKNILQGFFREIIRSNTTYDRLTEAAVDVFDKGYDPLSGNAGLQFRIRELRKSEDYMDLDWKASIFNYLNPRNGLHGDSDRGAIFYNDYVRNNQARFFSLLNGPLNEQFYEYVKFNIDSVLQFKGHKLLCIGIHPSPKSRDDKTPSGKIYIRDTDYAIFQMEYEVNAKPESKIGVLSTPGEEIMHKTLIKYQEYEGKMYLSMLYRKAFRAQMNFTKFKKTDGEEGLFFDEKLFVVNEIVNEKSKAGKFRKKEQQKKNIDLYSEAWEYNAAFWDTYNIITDYPLQPNVKKDLERETSLQNQFIRKND